MVLELLKKFNEVVVKVILTHQRFLKSRRMLRYCRDSLFGYAVASKYSVHVEIVVEL